MGQFVLDTFTDSNGTSISSHTGETGASWTALTGNGVTPTVQSNALDPSTGADANALWYASGVPASADYSVTTVVKYNGVSGASISGSGLRMSTSAQTGYFGFFFSSSFAIYKYVAGTLTAVSTRSSGAPTAGDEFTILFTAAGTSLTLRVQRSSDSQYLNSSGSWQAGATDAISTTDSSITAAGRAGFWLARTASLSPTLLTISADEVGGSTPITFTGTVPTLNGTQGSAFSQSLSSYFSGTETPFAYTVQSGSLPAGLTLNSSTGVISGTPTTAGTSSGIVVRGTDATPDTADTNSFSIVIAPPVIYDRVDTTDTFTGQTIMVLVPNANSAVPYSSGTPTRVILYAHGVGEDGQALLDDSLKEDVVLALLDAGYILACSNQHGENWGNQAGVDDLVGLERYVRANYNVENVAVWSQSMGGMSGLLAVAQGKFPCVGWLGTYPVCSLQAMHTLGTYASAINTAYGVTGSGINTYANRTIGHDPALLKGFSWRHIPMRFYASSSDTVVPKSTNSDVLAALVAGCTREATVVACTGNHGDASHFDETDYLAFFDRCFDTPVAQGRPASTKTVTVTLTSNGSTAVASATGLKWAWWDQITPAVSEYPTDKGTTETTDGSGVLTITVASNLTAGGVGWLVVTNSDGTTTQSPAHKAFSGPVEVS